MRDKDRSNEWAFKDHCYLSFIFTVFLAAVMAVTKVAALVFMEYVAPHLQEIARCVRQ